MYNFFENRNYLKWSPIIVSLFQRIFSAELNLDNPLLQLINTSLACLSKKGAFKNLLETEKNLNGFACHPFGWSLKGSAKMLSLLPQWVLCSKVSRMSLVFVKFSTFCK